MRKEDRQEFNSIYEKVMAKQKRRREKGVRRPYTKRIKTVEAIKETINNSFKHASFE